MTTNEKKPEYDIRSVSISAVSMYDIGLVHFLGDEIVDAGRHRHASITLGWGANIGFGELTIAQKGEKKLQLSTEGLSKDFVKAVLCKLVDEAEIVDFTRCSECKKCRTSLRSGGYYCPSCHPGPDEEPLEDYEKALPKLLDAARDVIEADQHEEGELYDARVKLALALKTYEGDD